MSGAVQNVIVGLLRKPIVWGLLASRVKFTSHRTSQLSLNCVCSKAFYEKPSKSWSQWARNSRIWWAASYGTVSMDSTPSGLGLIL